jgi:hypothetical protein
MLTKREVARIFREGTREEQLRVAYGTRYQDGWDHYDGFWDDPDIALREFRDCILPGYAAEERVERDYLIPAKGKGVWKDYTIDSLNDWHFMQGDEMMRFPEDFNQPDGHLWDMRGNEFTFDIKETKRPVFYDDDDELVGPGVCFRQTHGANIIFLYQRQENKLYFYSIGLDDKGKLIAEKVLPDYQFEKERWR